MGKETRSNPCTCSEGNLDQLINKVCANFVKQLEEKFDKKLDKLHDKISDVLTLIDKVKDEVTLNKRCINSISEKSDKLEQYQKRNSLRFLGFKEESDENVLEVMLNFINNKLQVICTKDNIDSVFRVGKTISNKNRPILINFATNIKKNEVLMAKKQNMKGTEFAIFEDLTKQRYGILLKAKDKFGKNNAWSSGGNIYVLRNHNKCLINAETDL